MNLGHLKSLTIAAIVVLHVLGASLVSAAQTQSFTIKDRKGRAVTCGYDRNKYVAGSVKAGVFTSYAKELKDLKKKLKTAVRPGSRRSIQKRIDQITKRTVADNRLCRSGPRIPVIQNLALTLLEDSAVTVQFSSIPAEPGTTFEIASNPTHGTLTGTGSARTYVPDSHFVGTDLFTYRAVTAGGSSEPATVTLTVTAIDGDFVGDPNSLRPYRDHLSRGEVAQLLGRVAFGGTPELQHIGETQGMAALLNALQNYQEDPTLHDRIKDLPITLDGYGNPIWLISGMVYQLHSRMIEGDPFKAHLSYLLMQHFPAALGRFQGNGASLTAMPDYVDMMRNHATGNFADLAGQEIQFNVAMLTYLDNQFNTRWTPNQNFGRELLEIFTLGSVNPITKLPNYTEEDVKASTAFVSGFSTFWGPGYVNLVSSYSPGLHDVNPYPVFQGTAAAANTNFDPRGWVDHILFNHPGAGVFIADWLFSSLAQQEPSPAVLEELANDLRSGGYELLPVVLKILRSSAMYSTNARKSCFASPVEYSFTLMRRLGMKFRSPAFMNYLRYNLLAGQQGLLEPANVFQEHCGANRGGRINLGTKYLNTQNLLNQYNMVLNLLWYQVVEQGYNVDSWQAGAGATAEQTVDHLGELMDIELNAAERAKIVTYLSQQRTEPNGPTGQPVYVSRDFRTLTSDQRRVKVTNAFLLMTSSTPGLLR